VHDCDCGLYLPTNNQPTHHPSHGSLQLPSYQDVPKRRAELYPAERTQLAHLTLKLPELAWEMAVLPTGHDVILVPTWPNENSHHCSPPYLSFC
jgi:hypothetical protein